MGRASQDALLLRGFFACFPCCPSLPVSPQTTSFLALCLNVGPQRQEHCTLKQGASASGSTIALLARRCSLHPTDNNHVPALDRVSPSPSWCWRADMEETTRLLIKNPSRPDKAVVVQLDATIAQLQQLLQQQYDGNPDPADQTVRGRGPAAPARCGACS